MTKNSKLSSVLLSSSGLLCFSLLLSLAIALFVEWRVFGNLTAINDDVRNQVYWMARMVDPSLYTHDLIADYFTQSSLISPAVWWLYKLASYWMDPLRFSQFLPFPLVLLSTFFLFKLAVIRSDARYAFWVCWLFNLFIWTVRVFAGGLPRAFSYPLLFLFLWQYEKRNMWVVNLCLCLSSLIYPPVLLLVLGVIIYDFWIYRKTPQQKLPQTVWWGLVGCAVISAWRYAEQSAPLFGSITRLQIALQIPELFPGGRIPLFLFPNFDAYFPWSFLQLPLQVIPHMYITLPVIALFVVWKLYQKKFSGKFGTLTVPTVIWKLAGVSVAFYLLAWLLLFYLYVPERYLQFTLPVIVVFALASIFERLSCAWGTSKKRLAALWLLPLLILAPLWKADLIHPSSDSIALMRFLQSTPKNAMISANLGVSSNIPALARRSVLLSHEGYIPFHQDYFLKMKIRLKDWLSAYYAKEPLPVKKFINQYPTDYIVVDTNDYESDRLTHLSKNYYHAFNPAFFQQLSQGTHKSQYLLYQLAQKHAIYQNGTYLVMRTSDLEKSLP